MSNGKRNDLNYMQRRAYLEEEAVPQTHTSHLRYLHTMKPTSKRKLTISNYYRILSQSCLLIRNGIGTFRSVQYIYIYHLKSVNRLSEEHKPIPRQRA